MSTDVQRSRFSTEDEGETEDFIRRMYVGSRIGFTGVPEGGGGFAATVAGTSELLTSRIRATVDYRAETEPFERFFAYNLTGGRMHVRYGREEAIQLAGDTTFYPLGHPLDIDLFDLEVQALQVPLPRLRAVAEQTAGIRAADLRFESITPVSAAMGRQWSALVRLAGATMLAEDPPVTPLLAEELARAVTTTALHTFPNTALSVSYRPGPGWVAPATVRRAAGFIHARADTPITPEQIAAAAGVSARALREGFRRHLDVSPTAYLRRIRLERAHQELQAGAGTVDEIARRWGWLGAREFAVAYRRRFGVEPTRTAAG